MFFHFSRSLLLVILSVCLVEASAFSIALFQSDPLLPELNVEHNQTSLSQMQKRLRKLSDSDVPSTLQKALEGTTDLATHAMILNEYHLRKMYDQAKETLELLREQNPTQSIYLNDLVQLSVLAGKEAEAKHYLRLAAEIFPNESAIHTQLGQWLYARKKTDLSLAELLRAQKAGQNDPNTNLLLASLLAQAGALQDTIETATSIAENINFKNSVRGEAAALVGKSYAILRNEKEGLEFLNLAIRLSPNIEDYYIAISQAYQQAGDTKASLQALKRGWNRLTSAPAVGQALSRQLLATGDSAGAIQTLTLVTDQHPNELDALRLLAQAHRSAGDPAKASQTWRRLIRKQPRYPMVNIFLAQSLAEEGAPPDQVLAALAIAEEMSPEDADLYYLRGRIYNSMKRYQEAVQQLQHAISLQPTFSGAYYQLGLAYQQLGQPNLAREQFERRSHLEGTAQAR